MIRLHSLRLVRSLIVLAGVAVLAGCAGPTPAPSTPTAVPPTEAAAPTPPVLEFYAGDIRLHPGGCTTLEWHVEGVLRAYVDGRGVAGTGTQEVCPRQTTTYTLKAALPDGSEVTRTAVVEITAPTEAPAEAAATKAAPAAPARPVTAVPAATVTATAAPTEAVSVELYPNNYVYELEPEDSCTAVLWRATGVTGLQLEREGMGRKDVGTAGREEVCFGERQVRFILYFKLPDGRDDRRELEIRRKS